MAPLPIRRYDDPVLRTKAEPIAEITPAIVQLAQDMIATMIAANGVGIAGPQVGSLLRIFIIVDEQVDEQGNYTAGPPEVIINPTLSNFSAEKTAMVEGCLSLPGLHVEVIRPQSLDVRYQNLKGEWIEERVDHFRARVMMHENDHLNGIMTINRISKMERKKLESHLLAIKRKYHP